MPLGRWSFMKFSAANNVLSSPPLVVGTIHSEGALKVAAKIGRGALDFLEVRVDAFQAPFDKLVSAVSKLKIPLIVTVRHPKEGCVFPLSTAERSRLYAQFLPLATLVDVELRSLQTMGHILQSAREAQKGIILSFHDFVKTPRIAQLDRFARDASEAGADLFKVAAVVKKPQQLCRLLEFTASREAGSLSVMGMGTYGKVSRLLLAQAGSVLNYGYLDRPQVAGQWDAIVLKKRLAELA